MINAIECKWFDEEDRFPRAITMTIDGHAHIFQRADVVHQLVADAREQASYDAVHGEPDPDGGGL